MKWVPRDRTNSREREQIWVSRDVPLCWPPQPPCFLFKVERHDSCRPYKSVLVWEWFSQKNLVGLCGNGGRWFNLIWKTENKFPHFSSSSPSKIWPGTHNFVELNIIFWMNDKIHRSSVKRVAKDVIQDRGRIENNWQHRLEPLRIFWYFSWSQQCPGKLPPFETFSSIQSFSSSCQHQRLINSNMWLSFTSQPIFNLAFQNAPNIAICLYTIRPYRSVLWAVSFMSGIFPHPREI